MTGLHFALNLAGAWLAIGGALVAFGVACIVCLDVIGLRRRYDALAVLMTARDLLFPVLAIVAGVYLMRL